MKLIVGLGNPGEKYKNNRHNVGYLLVDALLKEKLPQDLVVKKTNVFMNESGKAVAKLVTHYRLPIPSLWVIHDDLDIRLGEFKIQFDRGPKVHNGILSIEEELGTKDFWRVRIGVDGREPDNRTPGEDYVLQDFTAPEKMILNKTILKCVKELMDSVLR